MNNKWIQTIRKVAFESIKSSESLNDISSKIPVYPGLTFDL
jgi:hypothetical protein